MDKHSSKLVVWGSDKGKRVTRDNSNRYGSRFLALIEDVINVVDQDDSLVNGQEVPCHNVCLFCDDVAVELISVWGFLVFGLTMAFFFFVFCLMNFLA